jgi:hypothetical protein
MDWEYLNRGWAYELHHKRLDDKLIVTKEPLTYISRTCDEVYIPDQFITDGASMPWPINKWISPFHRWLLKPAILHDYLYRYFTLGNGLKAWFKSDNLMCEAMILTDTPLWGRAIVRTLLFLFGWIAWFRLVRKAKKLCTKIKNLILSPFRS